MEISPEKKDAIRNMLSLFMGEDEVERFTNLSEMITLIKQGQLCWQAPVAIGVHAIILSGKEATDAEKALLQDLITHTLEPLEALIESLLPKPGEKSLEGERARMLFHTRFGLGFLLLANGDKERAKKILHEMAATKLSGKRGARYLLVTPGILECTKDVQMGKWLAALLMLGTYREEHYYSGALYLVTEAAACAENAAFHTVLLQQAPELLDLLAAQYENTSREFKAPDLSWMDLFENAAEILSICQEGDSSEALPKECKKESAQFFAWIFGQIVGRFAIHELWRENPAKKLIQFREDKEELMSGEYGGVWTEKTFDTLSAVIALLCEYDPGRNWEKVRQHYVAMYTYCSYSAEEGMSLPEISPESDLYWAIRIGFADKILEVTTQRALVPQEVSPQRVVRDIESIKEIVSTMALRQLKEQQKLEEIHQRLPPGKREIHERLEQCLGAVWRELPAKVINTLIKAENYYRSTVNDDDAKVWFHKAVEASLYSCFVEPLGNFMQKHDYGKIAVCFPAPRGVEHKSLFQLEKLSPGEWSEVLEMLAAPSGKSLASLGTDDLREFMKAHFGGPRLPDFRSLASSLRMVQQYRQGSAHYQEAASRYDKEKWELEQMRNLVLGINGPSVIVHIFQLLAGGKIKEQGN